jgi:putative heme-binding domain-containing protein
MTRLRLVSTAISLILPGLVALGAPISRKSPTEDPHAKEGNSVPQIVALSPEEEAAILRDVKVAEGFEATLFANSAAANYPVFVAAEPDGTLYVSSDGNGSLGRQPKRGRVIRLRDTNGDGHADETKVFCEVDSPRGLVWDHDRLFLVHPPHLSEFIDADHDGVSEKQNILVQDIAFGFKDRPADHTTNGLSLGIDGWLYIAGGDFGFLKATGTDGKTLQHRGGGVIRVRPDGTGLEVYATGTRNILEVAISPLMDIFARDNTNDGGGWNVRFHHFTGLETHGYPRLYKNFNDECIQPLADYGGGSGCGAVYLDEPGFGPWNNAPLTADWGSNALWHHQVEPKGATFIETRKPESFVKMTRPTDADVDGMSRLYCASWKGATFNWDGPDVGYIIQVRPKGFQPTPLPDFAKASPAELQKLLDLQHPASYRRRVEARRELTRRGIKTESYEAQFTHYQSAERTLVSALKERATDDAVLAAIGHADPVVCHTAIRAAAVRGLWLSALSALDRAAEPQRTGLLRALAMMHQPEVITSLLSRLTAATDSASREGLLTALCRLHFREGEWTGDSWGTRPDTRGPYYQPAAWSETPRIATALRETLAKTAPAEAAFLVKMMNLNRIQSDDALQRIIALTKQDPKMIPDLITQLANVESLSADIVPLLLSTLQDVATSAHTSATLAGAITALTKSDSTEAVTATLAALDPLRKRPQSDKDFEAATLAFFGAPKLENHHQLIEQTAEKLDGFTSRYADAALLHLAARKTGSPESIQLSQKALDTGWTQPLRRQQILAAIGLIRHQASADKVLAALTDPDPAVKKAAEEAAKSLRLNKIEDLSPKISTLKPEAILAAVLKAKGQVALGEQVFTRATCVICHTVKESEAPKGPYLGNITQTYKRRELAEAILDPNKTIAQGFASELVTLKDGTAQMGFITLEGPTEVKLRTVTAQEFTFKTSDIQERQKLPISIMPPGLMTGFTVKEFASLLDYLQSLAAH